MLAVMGVVFITLIVLFWKVYLAVLVFLFGLMVVLTLMLKWLTKKPPR